MDEAIALAGFAENYTFVVQDEIQSCHCRKSQSSYHLLQITIENIVNGGIELNCSSEAFCIKNKWIEVPWRQWSDWSACNVSYGNGFMNRSRECSIMNFTRCCFDNSFDFDNCYDFIDFKENFNLTKGSLIGTLNVLRKEYTLSFYVKPIKFSIAWQNVLRLTLGNEFVTYGDANPGVWFHEDGSGKIRVHAAINGDMHYHYDSTTPLIVGQWSSIKICQSKYEGMYWFSVDVNEVNILRVKNSDARDFKNMKVYASDPWYAAQDGIISNLLIINGNDVSWMQWNNWSSWNVSYGNSFMNRSRECNVENSTMCCSDNSFDFQSCYAFWSQWSNWSSCNISYGIGFMNRTRICDASYKMNCPGNTTEYMNCCFNETFQGNFSEVLNCCLNETFQVSWMQWSNWSSCNVSYGNGFMNRSRECNVDNSTMCCSDNSFDFQSCYGFWSQWSNWSHCNISYGIGFMNRTRECNVSIPTMWCPSFSTELMNCCHKETFKDNFDVKNCCLNKTIIVTWSQWSLWSACNTSYLNGLMDSSRKCNFDIPVCCSGESFRFQTCSEWSTWSECSATCGNGYRTQSSTYKKRVTNTESCNLRNCPVDGVWGAWKKSNCSSTCGAGDVTFSRDCDPPPSDNGRNCMGISNYTQDCDNEIICPENGVWSDWTFWSLCNQPCEGGEMSRFRTCFPPKYGGQYCNGNDSESIECQPKSCKIVVLNLLLYFPDVQYTSDYSDLGNKIEQAIAKLYKKSFRIEFHYFIDGNSDFFDSAV